MHRKPQFNWHKAAHDTGIWIALGLASWLAIYEIASCSPEDFQLQWTAPEVCQRDWTHCNEASLKWCAAEAQLNPAGAQDLGALTRLGACLQPELNNCHGQWRRCRGQKED